MSVTVAKSAGFCFGVDRAVEMVQQVARESVDVATLGPIIHNHHVVRHFEELGVRVLQKPSEALPGMHDLRVQVPRRMNSSMICPLIHSHARDAD